MGIFANNRRINRIYYNNTPIRRVYVGNYFVWPTSAIIDGILSCYYNGYWIDEYPWTDDTHWVD